MTLSKSCGLAAVTAGCWSESAATHLLLTAGFSCPFLLPSFLMPRSTRDAKPGESERFSTLPNGHRKVDSTAVKGWEYHGNRRFQIPIGSTTIDWSIEIHNKRIAFLYLTQPLTSRLRSPNIAFMKISNGGIQHRTLHVTTSRTGPRKSGAPTSKKKQRAKVPASKSTKPTRGVSAKKPSKGRKTVSRPTKSRKITAAEPFGMRKSGQKSTSQKSTSSSGIQLLPRKSIQTVTPGPTLSTSDPPASAPTSSSRPKTRPKWIKAGISRTKPKVTGRKARRAARKLARNEAGTLSQVTDDKENVPQLQANSTQVFEPALARSQSKTAAKGIPRKETPHIGVAVKNSVGHSALHGRKSEQIASEDDHIPPTAGSRISVRGDGKVDCTLGKGRKVLGTSPLQLRLHPNAKRPFSTTATGEKKAASDTRGDGFACSTLKDSKSREVLKHPESEQTSLKFSRTELDTLLGVDNPEKFGAGTAHGELKVREPGSLRVRRMITGDSQNNHSGGHQTRHVPLKEAPRPEIGIKTDGVRHKLAIVGSDPKFSARPISKKNTPTAKLMAKSKPVPTFISRILSSPNMKSWYKSKSGFWVDVVKRWYVPDHIQNRLILDTKTAMLNNKPKESLTRNIFNHDHPMPLRPYHFHKLGALPIEVIQLFEETAKHDIDLLFELARRGEYSAARWIVRRILHPQIPDIHELEEGGAGDVLGTFNWAVHDKLKKLNGHDAENLSAARAGDFGLGHLLSDPSSSNILNTQLWHVKLARQGLGFVLRSIGKMLVAADPSALLTSSPKTFFSYSSTIPSPARKSGYSVLGNKQDKVNEYRRLLAFSKELLAYLHNSSIIPKNLYSSDINPRLSILKTRILTGLADAVWRHQELSQLELKEEEAQNQAYTVPDYGCRLHGYWRGGFETLTGDSPQWSKLWKGDSAQTASLSPGAKRQEAVQLAEMGNRGEREVLIELTLRICALAGFGCAGSRILKDIITQGGWSWIDYKAMWPEEYRPEDLALREELESTDGLPGQWGVRGYAVLPPPIRTVPLKLPVDIISQISSALIDSVAEGKGIKEVIKGLEQLGEMFGREIFGQDGSQIASRSNNTISRLVGLWEDECEIGNGDPHSGEMILMLIQKWSDLESKVPGEISPGEASTEIRVWYRVLQNYINVENPDGAIRIWNAMQNRISILLPGNDAPIAVPKDNRDYQNEYRKREETHYYHPPWVSGPFLAMLNQYKMTSFGDSLLHPHEQSPFPIIPRHYYHLPQITPPLLALASLKKDLDLLNKILASLPLHIAGAVTHSTITSILNTYLQFDDFSSAKEVLNYLTAQGTQIDGIDIAVLVENILRHSKNDGYNFVEQVMKSEDTANPLSEFSPNLRVGSQWGNWKLPLRATAVKRDQQYTVFEGQLIARTPSSDPAPPPKPKMSPSGWISVLNHAIETSDRQRVEWALKGLGIDLRKRGSMSTKIFNILLKGVIIRNGPIAGWNMITEHCVDNPESGVGGTHDGYWVRKVGKGAEWHWVHGGKTRDGVVPDLVTFRTVLDGAVKQHKDIEKEISMEWKRVRKHDWWAEQEDFAVESGDVPRLQKGLDTGVKQTRNRELEEWKANISKLEKKRKELEELVRLCRKKMKMMGGL